MRDGFARLLFCSALSLSAYDAGAAEPDAQIVAEREKALMAQGLKALSEHRDEAALAAFTSAHELSHSSRAMAQMGIAEGALGRWIEASGHLHTALAGSEPWIVKNRVLLEQALATMDSHLGQLEVSCNIPGATLQINGKPQGIIPHRPGAPIPLLAGSALIEVRADGYVPVSRSVQIVAGTFNRELVELVALPPTAAGTVQSPSLNPVLVPAVAVPPGPQLVDARPGAEKPTSKTGLYAGVGAAVGVAVVAGITLGLLFGIPKNAPDPQTSLGTKVATF